MTTPIPQSVLEETARHLAEFKREWHGESPLKIHSRDLDHGGTPRWTPLFVGWLLRGPQYDSTDQHRNDPQTRLRLTRAFRTLRHVAPREFEVLYRMMVLDESVESTQAWLNARAERGGHHERYSAKDVIVIVISAIDKITYWY